MNSTILIVGASSGIGKETALIFSKKNWKVIACSRNVKKLNDLSKLSINKNNKSILTSKLDVTNSSMLSENISKILKKFGKLFARNNFIFVLNILYYKIIYCYFHHHYLMIDLYFLSEFLLE